MEISYRKRRLLSLIILLVVLPIYIVLVVLVLSMFGRLPIFVELIVYVVLGVIWVAPLKFIFKGIGRSDPDAKDITELESNK